MLFFIFLLIYTTFYTISGGVFQNEFEKVIANRLMLHTNIQTSIFGYKFDGAWKLKYVIETNSMGEELKVRFKSLDEFITNIYDLNVDEDKLIETFVDHPIDPEVNLKEYYKRLGHFEIYIKKFLRLIYRRHITLDSKYYRMLEKQSFCLVNFLLKKFGTDNIIGYEAHKELNEETVVDNNFKIKFNGKYYIFRFNQEFNFSTHHHYYYYYYYEGSPEYNDLYNCNQIIEEAIPQYEVDEYDRKFINLNKLYKRFNPKQLYFNYIPIFEEDQILQVNQDLIENNKEGCSVCLSDFMIGDYVKKTSCGHIFHNNCLQHWLISRNNCPLCRYVFTPKVIEH